MTKRLLVLAWLLAGPAAAQHMHEHHPRADGSPDKYGADFARFARSMDAGMEKMMHGMHGPGYTGNPDADFLAMMIPHHEGAVEMARLVLKHGRDPVTRRLAEDIIAGQTAEIESMKRRLAILRERPDSEPGGFPALGGTRGP
jgi:uncharacterized protein (DUF305 family)